MIEHRRLSFKLLRASALACGPASASGCDALVDLIRSISDGAECTDDAQCLGGVCVTDFPGGYCSTADCFSRGCSNIFGAECAVLPASTEALCYESCVDAAGCRPGYGCFDLEDRRVCLPSSYSTVLTAAGALGSGCAGAVECASGVCLTNLVGGYCSVLGCADDAACGDGRCLALDAAEGEVAATACFRRCADASTCRFGYSCVDPDGLGGACVPTPTDERTPVRNPAGADDGQPCTVDINCKGGTCLREAEGYPGGYCTTLDCATVGCNAPPGAESACRAVSQQTTCYVACTDASACRDGYACVGAGASAGYCAPPVGTTGPRPVDGGDAISVTCETEVVGGTTRRVGFDVAATTTAFSVVPFSETATVRPVRLRLPDGSVGADFSTTYGFMDVNPSFIESAAPVFFPGAPQFASIVSQGGGRYELEVTSSDTGMCYYVLQKSRPGATLSLNIYFVGVEGLTAANADQHAGFTAMMDVVRRVYTTAAIDIDQVRLFDVDASAASRYAVIRDFNELFRIVGLAGDPGPTLDERLSVDVFLINGFAVPQAPGLLGVSLGLPGVPGLHGVPGSALVFTAEYLDANAAQTGQTMAHEIGHFNGLRHTSEHGGETWDPLSDTPQCSNPDRGATCPDAGNLMFPFSLGRTQETVTSEQATVLRASPHVR